MNQWGEGQARLDGLPETGTASTTTDAGGGPVAREVEDQVRKAGVTARERAMRLADEKRGGMAGGLKHVAGKLEEMSHEPEAGRQLEPVLGYVAKVARRIADDLENKPASELLDTAKRQLRAKPALCIAGCFALGFFGARLLAEEEE